MNYFSQACEAGVSRLPRLMCGKALPFRNTPYICFEAMPQGTGARHSLASSIYQLAESISLSAHQAAKPRSSVPEFVLSSEAN